MEFKLQGAKLIADMSGLERGQRDKEDTERERERGKRKKKPSEIN